MHIDVQVKLLYFGMHNQFVVKLDLNHHFIEELKKMEIGVIFALALLVLAVLAIYNGIKIVPQGMQWTVERLGRYRTTLQPGFNLIIPFIDNVAYRQSMKETVMDIPAQEVITKDNAMVTVDGIVFYQIVNASKAAYEVNDLTKAVTNLAMTNIRSVMGAMDLDELLSKRDEINLQLLRVMDEATDTWGVKVLRVEIKDITPPKDLVDAMARQMKAEREKRALITEAEGERQSEVLRAEGEKRSAILEAEGRKESAYRDAEARERLAEAEAKAVKSVSEAIAQGDAQAINYFVAQKYVEALSDIASAENQKVIMMPLEASQVIGALGGISEIAKSAFDKTN